MMIRLRRVTLDDGDILFRWLNDIGTRAMSRDTAPIAREVHDAWLARNVDHPEHLILMVLDDDEPVGVIRFDERDKESYEVAITVAPEKRGQQIGYVALALACGQMPGTLIAEIRADNRASQTIFEKCGFRRITDHDLPFRLYRRDRL